MHSSNCYIWDKALCSDCTNHEPCGICGAPVCNRQYYDTMCPQCWVDVEDAAHWEETGEEVRA